MHKERIASNLTNGISFLDINHLLAIRTMHSSLIIAIILLLIQSILGAYTQDNRVIIGSSVGGVLGLVS